MAPRAQNHAVQLSGSLHRRPFDVSERRDRHGDEYDNVAGNDHAGHWTLKKAENVNQNRINQVHAEGCRAEDLEGTAGQDARDDARVERE